MGAKLSWRIGLSYSQRLLRFWNKVTVVGSRSTWGLKGESVGLDIFSFGLMCF